MVEWCPRCNAQLPPGLKKCPRCGKKLHPASADEYSLRDILWLTLTIFGIVVVPLIIIIGIVWLIFLH